MTVAIKHNTWLFIIDHETYSYTCTRLHVLIWIILNNIWLKQPTFLFQWSHESEHLLQPCHNILREYWSGSRATVVACTSAYCAKDHAVGWPLNSRSNALHYINISIIYSAICYYVRSIWQFSTHNVRSVLQASTLPTASLLSGCWWNRTAGYNCTVIDEMLSQLSWRKGITQSLH